MKLMLYGLFGFLVATGASAQRRDASPDIAKKTAGSIAGMVVKFGDSTPVKRATVRLRNADQRDKSFIVTTSVEGKFLFEDIPPGRYSLGVVRDGYVPQEYGQRHAGDPSASLTLSPGRKMTDLIFKLLPAAVISGRAFDEDGEPLPWVHVTAFRWSYSKGKRTFKSEIEGSSNDQGEYRLFNAIPGRYFITATYKPGATIVEPGSMLFRGTPASDLGYIPAYYQNTNDPSKATPITLKAGEEVRSIDFFLRPSHVSSVRGRVFNAVTDKFREGIYVRLLSRETKDSWSFQQLGAASRGPDGTFEISNVPPGAYDAVAFWNNEGKNYSARQALEVGTADVEGILLTIAPGLNISGRLFWDGKPALDADDLHVDLLAVGGERVANTGSVAKVDGSFTLGNVPEGQAHVVVVGASMDTYVKKVRYAGNDSPIGEIAVRRGIDSDLEITLGARAGQVEGMVTNSDTLPVAGAWVVLVPDAPLRSRDWLYKQTTTDQRGHFVLRGITPGDYRLFSWEEAEEGAWEDESFLKPFEEKAIALHVAERDSKTIDLNTIEMREARQQNQ